MAVEILLQKTKKALKKYPVKTFVLAGGVAANHELREKMQQMMEHDFLNIQCIFPKLSLCGDNAAMIGMCAYYKLKENQQGSSLDISALASYPIENF